MDERRRRHWRRILPGGAAYRDPSRLCGNVGGGLVGPCAVAEKVRGVSVLAARCKGPMDAACLGWRAWCGDPGVGWAEVSLSWRFHISESLAEE